MRKPPKIAAWALKMSNREKNRDIILGDFEEFFNEIYEDSGAFTAYLWYWKQALKSMPRFILTTNYWRFIMFKNYAKVVLRNILKHKVFSFINIMGLAIGMAICLLVIKLIFSIYSIDRFHENKDRIFRFITYYSAKDHASKLATAPLPLSSELEKFPEVETVVRIKKNFGGYAAYQKKKFPVHGYYTDKEFFTVFSFELKSGDPATALANPYSLVLTETTAAKFFGDRNPLGETMSFNDLGEFKITGVMKDTSHLKSHLRFECLTSASTLLSLEKQKKVYASLQNWKNINDNYVYFMLRDNASSAKIEESLHQAVKPHYSNTEEKYTFKVQALTGISPGLSLANFLSPPVPVELPLLFSIIAFIILLIACFNYTNLSLAKALSRAKEVGIRKVVGANRLKLFNQFIGEAVIIALIALFFAFILLQVLEPLLVGISSEFRLFFNSENLEFDLLLTFVLFALFTGGLAGFFPALSLSKFSPILVLKDITKVKVFSRLTLRRVLLVFQFFISFVFIISTIVLYKQIRHEINLDQGFNPENIVNVELQKTDYETFRQEIAGYHNISEVSASSFLPALGARWITLAKHTQTSDKIEIDNLSVDENFIGNLEMGLVAGRNFPKGSRMGEEKFVILTEKAVKFLGFASTTAAIGQVITFEKDNNLEVVGVVKDFISASSSSPVLPLALRVNPKDYHYANIRIKGKDVAGTIEFLTGKWKKIEPVRSFRYRFYEDQLDEFFSAPRNLLKGIGFITLLTILVAFFGLLGMVIYDTDARIKEIGIRKVMGGTPFDITMEISKGFVFLLSLAALLATPAAWFLGNMFLQNMANRISLGFGIFASGLLLMFSIGFIIIFSQTIRAANRNPVDMLRCE